MAFRRSFARSIPWLASILICVASSLALSAPQESAAVSGGPSVAGTAVDSADDPWLSDEGPAVAAPVGVASEQVVASWRAAGKAPHARAAALRRARLELGLGDLPAPASVIVAAATEDDPEIFSEMAVRVAPGVPSFRVDHGLALWRSGDIGGAILALGTGAWVTATQFSSQLWLLSNVSLLLMLVVVVASLGFIAIAALEVFPHAAHDFGDLLSDKMPTFARHAALGSLLLVPLAFGEGLAGLTLALFVLAFAYGASRQRSALVMAAVFLMIGLLPLAQVVTLSTDLVDRDPTTKSVLAVLAGTATTADLERLEVAAAEDEWIASHALAYRARRHGLAEESSVRLDEMIARNPTDAVALANRANIEKREGRTQAAIGLYERAAAQVASSTVLFNLSQAYANAFRMEEYEATLVRAQMLDDRAVAELSSLDDAKLVADMAYPIELVRDRLAKRVLDHSSATPLAFEVFAPGLLGADWPVLAGAFGLAIFVSLLLAGRWDHASVCSRCGHRICTRCEETVWSDELCEGCHHLFKYPEATDPSLRMARLQALSRRETRIDRIVLALSLAIPGFAGFAARRPDLALVSLLLFSWTAAWIAWPSGILSDPLLMGSAAVIAFAVPGVLAALAYLSVVFFSLIVRKSR